MNQDFALKATPAAARKIMRLSSVMQFDLDDRIRDLAEQDKLSEQTFSDLNCTDLTRRSFLQFVHDHDWRCIVPFVRSTITRELLIRCALLPNAPRPIVIGAPSGFHYIWQDLREQLAISDMVIGTPSDLSDHNFQKQRREGLLVLEWANCPDAHPTTGLFTALAREWRHAMIWGDPTINADSIHNNTTQRFMDYGLRTMVRTLWPDAPTRFLVGTQAIQGELRTMGFIRQKMQDIAFLYGIFVPPLDITD